MLIKARVKTLQRLLSGTASQGTVPQVLMQNQEQGAQENGKGCRQHSYEPKSPAEKPFQRQRQGDRKEKDAFA